MSNAGRGLPLLSGPPPSPPPTNVPQPDSCRKCGKEFNILFARSRKCNHCGYLYCHNCSDYLALMPRRGPETGYDVMNVCGYCIEYLTITAGGKTALKSMALGKLRKYANAYDVKISHAVEKDDVIEAIMSTRRPDGCLPPENEHYYRTYSVPAADQRPGLRNMFRGPPSSSNQPPPPPPRQPRQQSFARPDLAPDTPMPPPAPPPRPQGQQQYYNPPPGPPPRQQQQQQRFFNPPPNPPPRPHSSYANSNSHAQPQFHTPPPSQGWSQYPGNGNGRQQGFTGGFNPHQGRGYGGGAPPPPPRSSRPQAQPQSPPRQAPPASTSYSSGPPPAPPPPRPQPANNATARPAPPTPPNLDELLDMSPADIRSLSISALKSILFTNHVNAGQVLEKDELVKKVQTLVDDERQERQRQQQAHELEELERLQRERERREEQEMERRRREEREAEQERERIGREQREAEQAAADREQASNQQYSNTGSEFHQNERNHDSHQFEDGQDHTRRDGPSPMNSPPRSSTPKPQPHPSYQERSGLCVVCQDEEANIAIVDCGHLAMCRGCSELIMNSSRECPLCRTRIVTEARLLRIFKT